MKGKFIVFYGINNLGKSTQAKKLFEFLKAQKLDAEYLKYPIYNLEPSGKILNNYLREGNKYNLTPKEAQLIYILNRTQFQKELEAKLDAGINIIAEDYTGTGIAWGAGAGVDEEFLIYANSHLLKEDVAFLFEGERFSSGIEENHKHEKDDELTMKVKATHAKLGEKYNWIKINANQDINKIFEEILEHIKKILNF